MLVPVCISSRIRSYGNQPTQRGFRLYGIFLIKFLRYPTFIARYRLISLKTRIRRLKCINEISRVNNWISRTSSSENKIFT